MKTAEHPDSLAGIDAPICFAAGFFDGLHRGHQAVIRAAQAHASELGGEAWALTFVPHPAKIVRPDSAPKVMMPIAHKHRVLERMGLDGCLAIPFTAEFSQRSPEDFFAFLHGGASAMRSIHVGADWHFGRNRAGNADTLRELAAPKGIEVAVVTPVRHDAGPISSTRIRTAIASGDLDLARALIGRDFGVIGTVVRGDGRGRSLGAPTANIDHGTEVLPPCGVYAARIRIDGQTHDGVLNLGLRPTVDAGATRPSLEVHIFDLKTDLYGQTLEVDFVEFVREEREFSSADGLKSQIAADIEAVRARLRD